MSSILLVIGHRLDASDDGVGTHTQLGLLPCGFLAATGLPCATCGVTTAFTHAVHGRLVIAFKTQPAGLACALITAVGMIIGVYALTTGTPLGPLARWLWRPGTVGVLGALVIGSWIYKSLLMVWGAHG